MIAKLNLKSYLERRKSMEAAPRFTQIKVKMPNGILHSVTNSEALPAFYCMPAEVLMNMQPPIRNLPRRPHELLLHQEYREIIESDLFLEHICDGMAYLAWSAMGMSGWMEYYSGWSPQWCIAHEAPLWIWGMQQAGVLPTNRQLFLRPYCFKEIPVISLEEAYAMVATAAPYVLNTDDRGEVLRIAREFPCEEDFDEEKKFNRRLLNFRREWYHRRTKHPTDVPLECLTYHLHNDHSEFEDAAVAQADTERFLNGLSETDRRIMELRVEGRPLEEIAQLVGFQTHSAVLKRIRKIGKAYERYAGDYLGFDEKRII